LPVIGLILPSALGMTAMMFRARWAPVPRRVAPLARYQA